MSKKCQWVRFDPEIGSSFKTGCGQEIVGGGIIEDKQKCPFCKREIEIGDKVNAE